MHKSAGIVLTWLWATLSLVGSGCGLPLFPENIRGSFDPLRGRTYVCDHPMFLVEWNGHVSLETGWVLDNPPTTMQECRARWSSVSDAMEPGTEFRADELVRHRYLFVGEERTLTVTVMSGKYKGRAFDVPDYDVLSHGRDGTWTWRPFIRPAGTPADHPAYRAAGLPASAKVLRLDLGNKVPMELVLIPAGRFAMGSPKTERGRSDSEGPLHEVAISKPFYMGVYEVTQEQFEAVMGKGSNRSRFWGAQNPVETVRLGRALEFCQRLSHRTGKAVSLPTEAQWEYACRAGSTTPFSTGESIGTDQANYNGKAPHGEGGDGEYRARTMPVGSFAPNAWGLYDMHGNVSEFCQDLMIPYADIGAPKPQWDPFLSNAVRGGFWDNGALDCRSASRRSGNSSGSSTGFRVVVAE